jgi:hypothetical protein
LLSLKHREDDQSMARPKIDPDALRRYLDAGHTQADAARYFGVSEPAIHQRLRKMRQLTSHVVALEKAGAVVEEKLSATARLEKVQRVIDEELDAARQRAQQPGVDRAALTDIIIRLTAEVRQQLNLQLAITRTLVDLRVVKEFQESVVEVIRSESPGTAQRIVTRLKERRALRPSADLPTLIGGGAYADLG